MLYRTKSLNTNCIVSARRVANELASAERKTTFLKTLLLLSSSSSSSSLF